jgi:hypothetical protein
VTKLHAILLMEGDFNAMNKIIYGHWMIENARRHHLMPEEIFSKKIEWQTTGCCVKPYFMTSPISLEYQPQSRWSTQQTVTTGLPTP